MKNVLLALEWSKKCRIALGPPHCWPVPIHCATSTNRSGTSSE